MCACVRACTVHACAWVRMDVCGPAVGPRDSEGITGILMRLDEVATQVNQCCCAVCPQADFFYVPHQASCLPFPIGEPSAAAAEDARVCPCPGCVFVCRGGLSLASVTAICLGTYIYSQLQLVCGACAGNWADWPWFKGPGGEWGAGRVVP